MDIRQLHYFKEIVKQGSISKAAEVLNIAQPPLSQLLKKLEDELGTTLIHRYRKKWELTETGSILYEYAEQVLSQMNEMKIQILEIENGLAGVVKIGVSTACSNLLIDYVSKYRKQYPMIKIIITTGSSEEILNRLNQREIDLALLLKPDNSNLFEMKLLNKQPFVLIVPTEWVALLSNEPTIEEIAKFPLIMLGAMEGHSLYENILSTFELNDVTPQTVIECKDITMVVSLVSRGLGISIIPRMDYKTPTLEHVTIYNLNQFNFSIEPVMIQLKNTTLTKAAVQFWNIE